ncbi:hypothetical protein OIU77_030174 [Salix suchowensis]|uniref:Uncharacterized protein n=1 Tax=Salix suchowensis TaxID=1278906 RepID=A0ABQ9BB11_9ROSI|nr:hypothetical protein OIU77_030174 [Salix suchowensis]
MIGSIPGYDPNKNTTSINANILAKHDERSMQVHLQWKDVHALNFEALKVRRPAAESRDKPVYCIYELELQPPAIYFHSASGDVSLMGPSIHQPVSAAHHEGPINRPWHLQLMRRYPEKHILRLPWWQVVVVMFWYDL